MAVALASLKSKFQGSILGGLLGDCLGQPFEGEPAVLMTHVIKYFEQLYDPKVKVPYKPYTDDTAMTKVVAQSLINCNGYDAKDMAKRFTMEYFNDNQKRGYGSSVPQVFTGLRLSNFEEPYEPAKRQFSGLGSYGNGAAMRISPVGLYYHDDVPGLIDVASKSSQITHFNKLGYRGAILQALAVREALYFDTANGFNQIKFVDIIIEKMRELESIADVAETFENTEKFPYVKKLEIVKEFLHLKEIPKIEDIHNKLGVHVSAHRSVPTALYCFLLSQNPISGIDSNNVVERTIQFAISLGGDTDTIASMAGSLSGSLLGFESIPKELLKHCEEPDFFINLANDLFQAVQAKKSEMALKQ